MQETMERNPGKPALVARYVHGKLQQLLKGGNEALTRSQLAQLRRGIGKAPGSQPELWDLTLEGMPADLSGVSGQPSWGEWAVHLALTLFALHQQGRSWQTDCMHQPGMPLGQAVRRLAPTAEELPRIKRRFDQVVTADSPREAAHHLRGLITMLAASGIPLDYPQLAQDFYRYQIPQERDRVRLKWGREFYAVPAAQDEDPEKTENSQEQMMMEEMNHEEQ